MAADKPRIRVTTDGRVLGPYRAELTGPYRAELTGDVPSLPVVRSPSPRLVRPIWGGGGPNAVQDYALGSRRSQSREEIAKNGLADAGVEALVSNIVGSGIKPQFTTSSPEFNKQLAALFLEWTDESDADGRLDFYGQQALAVRSMIEGGDAFGRLRARRPTELNTVPLQVQLLEAEYCPEDLNRRYAPPTETSETVFPIRAGVEFSPIGRRVAYHLTREHPLDGIVLGAALNNQRTVRVPATEVMHLAAIRRPGQVRGEPWLTRALAKLHDLDQYDDAQLIRQKIAALFAGFVVTPPDEDLGTTFARQSQPYEDGVALASLEPGTMQVLEDGKQIEFSAPPSPGDSYADFVREQKRGVALAIGLMYEQLSGDYSQVNDRTFRASVNEFRRRCAMWQHHLVVYQWCRPVLRRWLELGILSGRITLPAGVSISDAARAKWVPEGWAYINPVQDVQAKREEVRGGFRSRSEIVSEDGYDVEQIDAEQSSDITRADRLGLVHDSDARKTSNSGVAQTQAQEPPASSEN